MSEKKETPILKAEHLTKMFPVKKRKLIEKQRYVHAAEDVSFEVYPGEVLGIVGESGSGKSTLARTILALTPSTSGQVFYQGEDITDFKVSAGEKRRLRSEIQMIFQDQASSYAEAKEKIQHLLEVVGLQPAVFDRYPHEFSGGQRQRIGIVRALAVNPKLIFCDESVSALDVSVQAQILNLFQSLKEQFHLTYVFIGHDLAVVRYISDRVMVMYLGKVMEIAPYSELTGDDIHPYTRALLSAVPEPSIALHKERILLEGDIPSAVDPPAGCRFCQRCFMAKPICFEQEPDMKTVGTDHCVRCHFAKEG